MKLSCSVMHERWQNDGQCTMVVSAKFATTLFGVLNIVVRCCKDRSLNDLANCCKNKLPNWVVEYWSCLFNQTTCICSSRCKLLTCRLHKLLFALKATPAEFSDKSFLSCADDCQLSGVGLTMSAQSDKSVKRSSGTLHCVAEGR